MGRQRIAAVTPWLHIRAIPTLGMPARVVRAGENTDLWQCAPVAPPAVPQI